MRRARYCDAGPGARRHRRRLRHDPFRRSLRKIIGGGACGVEGRAQWRRRGDGCGDGFAGGDERGDPRRARACIAQESYEVGPEFFATFLQGSRLAKVLCCERQSGPPDVRSAWLHRRRAPPGRALAFRRQRSRHLCRRSALLQLPPHDASQGTGLWAAGGGDRAGVSATMAMQLERTARRAYLPISACRRRALAVDGRASGCAGGPLRGNGAAETRPLRRSRSKRARPSLLSTTAAPACRSRPCQRSCDKIKQKPNIAARVMNNVRSYSPWYFFVEIRLNKLAV